MNRSRHWTATLPLILALAAVGCGDDGDEAKPSPILEKCDADADTPCDEGLVCVANADGETLCHIPPGSECDPDADESGCTPDAECSGAQPDAGLDVAMCLVSSGGECDPAEPYCAGSLTCAELQDGSHRCFGQVLFVGMVSDALDSSAIEGAHVIGIDDEGVAVTDVAESDATGAYTLSIPALRDATGAPVDATYTLRAAATDYQVFPGGLRSALPISLTQARSTEGAWTVSGTLTDIVLIPLPDDGVVRLTISGTVLPSTEVVDDRDPVQSEVAGVLVVASGNGDALSALSDRVGNYTIFNATQGSYEIHGYAADVQLTPTSTQIDAASVTDVDLLPSSKGLTRLTGNIQLVNAPGGAATSVILVVESTFDATFVRGEAPRGLRAPRSGPPDVQGGFVIEGVPSGTYVVLAAYENDDLVRDPDSNIAGTDFVYVTVSGGDVDLSDSFKVTEALAIGAPGADDPTEVTSAPSLSWADDSSEDWYEVRVYNAYGDEVWSDLQVVAGRGSSDVSVAYGGPMEVGMYYQFRVSSWRQPGNGDASAISMTEDLRGVFYVAP